VIYLAYIFSSHILCGLLMLSRILIIFVILFDSFIILLFLISSPTFTIKINWFAPFSYLSRIQYLLFQNMIRASSLPSKLTTTRTLLLLSLLVTQKRRLICIRLWRGEYLSLIFTFSFQRNQSWVTNEILMIIWVVKWSIHCVFPVG